MHWNLPATWRSRGRCLRRGRSIAAWLLPVLLLLAPSKAQGYVDPGAGAMIWQMLVAAFLGAVFYLRRLIPRRPPKKTLPQPRSSSTH